MRSRLVHDPIEAPQSVAPASAPPLPLVSYFMHAGVSYRESVRLSEVVMSGVRDRLRKRYLEKPEERLRYFRDRRFRERINQFLLAEEITALHFSLQELEKLEEGLRGLGLVSPERRPATAVVTDQRGVRTEFTFERERGTDPQDEQFVLRDKRTGETHRLSPRDVARHVKPRG